MRFVTTLLITATTLAAQSLTGTWYSEERSKGGIGALYKFQPQGKAHFSPSAIVEYTYRIEGTQLTLTPPTGPEETLQITTINAQTLKLKAPQGDLTYRRVSGKDPNSITGKWTFTTQMEGRPITNNWNFRPDGTAILTVPFTWQAGTYAVTSDKNIRIALGSRPPIRGSFTWDGEVLVLPNAKGTGHHRYRRLE
ncbi:hypothetical protein F183_A37470 [Bryobacterales bacterium F-183]|nr:hypothetical protein F183_A37470 [Bryobacterales bacterium F-183]